MTRAIHEREMRRLLTVTAVGWVFCFAGGCSRERQSPAVETARPSLGEQARTLYPTLLDYLLTSRLAEATVEMAIEAMEYRLNNHPLSPEVRAETLSLLGRAHVYQKRYELAAEAFEDAAKLAPEGPAGTFAAAFRALVAGETDAIDGLHGSESALLSFYCMTRGAFGSLPAGAMDGDNALEDAYFKLLRDPQTLPVENPTMLLPSFEGEYFSNYDPFALFFLSQLYLHKLRVEADGAGLKLLDWIVGKNPQSPEPATGSLADDVTYLVFQTSAGEPVPAAMRERIAGRYQDGRPADRDLVSAYLAMADGEIEEAFVHLRRVAQSASLPRSPRLDLTSVVLLDLVPLSYRVRSINYTKRWILGAPALQESFTYLKIPYSYLAWMQGEGLLN